MFSEDELEEEYQERKILIRKWTCRNVNSIDGIKSSVEETSQNRQVEGKVLDEVEVTDKDWYNM